MNVGAASLGSARRKKTEGFFAAWRRGPDYCASATKSTAGDFRGWKPQLAGLLSELKLFCIMTCVTPSIRTSFTLLPCFRHGRLAGARRATGKPCQGRAAAPRPACIAADD